MYAVSLSGMFQYCIRQSAELENLVSCFSIILTIFPHFNTVSLYIFFSCEINLPLLMLSYIHSDDLNRTDLGLQ